MASEPVEQIAAEAEDARTRIAGTIDEIQDRLDPRRIVGDAVERLTGTSAQFLGKAGSTARAHPVAIGAAVAAVGLALLARNKLSKAKVDLGDDFGDYTDYDDGFGFAETRPTRLYDDEGSETATPPARAVLARAGASVDSSPLVAIVLGLAAGAALGAIFPATEAERRALGETGSKLGAAARAAARRAADELDAHGLTVDNVRSRASEATRNAKRAARAVVDAARDELKD